MAVTKSRVAGSGYTLLNFQGKPLIFLENFNDVPGAPVAAAVDVHPLDSEHPVEIVLPKAVRAGQLTFTLTEHWDQKAWERLPGFTGATDILEVFKRQMSSGAITAQKVIKNAENGTVRTKTYHNLTIVDVDDTETIQIAAMTIPRRITCRYTHATG